MDLEAFEKQLRERGLFRKVDSERRKAGITMQELLCSKSEPAALSVRLSLYKWLIGEKGFTYVAVGKLFQRRHSTIMMAISRAKCEKKSEGAC
jgi:hypothetical protein